MGNILEKSFAEGSVPLVGFDMLLRCENFRQEALSTLFSVLAC